MINRVTTQIAQMELTLTLVPFIPLLRRVIVRQFRSALPEILQSVIRLLCMYRVSSTPGFLEQRQSCYWALSTYIAYQITDSIVKSYFLVNPCIFATLQLDRFILILIRPFIIVQKQSTFSCRNSDRNRSTNTHSAKKRHPIFLTILKLNTLMNISNPKSGLAIARSI